MLQAASISSTRRAAINTRRTTLAFLRLRSRASTSATATITHTHTHTRPPCACACASYHHQSSSSTTSTSTTTRRAATATAASLAAGARIPSLPPEPPLLQRLAPLLSSFSSSSSSSSSSSHAWSTTTASLSLLLLLGLQQQQQQDNNPTQCKALRNIHDFYKIVEKPIGAGGFGVVCVGAHRETGETVAIKQLPKKTIREKKVMQEVQILRVAGEHRSIIGFRDLFQDDENWYIVMEMAEGGELFDRLVEQGAYSESNASEIMRQIVEAITYLHQQGVVHCDLKPENLLLATKESDTSNMRLVDFGSAFLVEPGKLVARKGTGTIAYSAPEVISGRPCGYKADMWALGVLMYILLSGYHPFDPTNDADDDQIGERIVKEQDKYVAFDHPVWDSISPAAKDLVRSLLVTDAEKRPTAAELLHDPWIASGTELSQEPLEASVENLRKFHRGRRRLKALMLAIMAGLANEPADVPGTTSTNTSTNTSTSTQTQPPPPTGGGVVRPEEDDPLATGGGGGGASSSPPTPLGQKGRTNTQSWSTSLSNTLRLKVRNSNLLGAGGAAGGGGNDASGSDLTSSSSSTTTSSSTSTNTHTNIHARKHTLRTHISQYVSADALGSRRAAVRMLDPDNKGYITEEDLARVASYLGEDLSEKELTEMVLAGHGDPHTKVQTTVTHQQLVNLLPPLCPSKVFQRRELLYAEGEVDHTYYLLQKGEVLLRFDCPVDGRSSIQVAVESLKGGDTFGEMEMMIEGGGKVGPRVVNCECLSPRCEVIAIDDHLFSLLTDVFDSTHTALRDKAEGRCKKLVDKWADNLTSAHKRKFRRYEPLWNADKRDPHKLFVVKDGFLEVETQVEALPPPTTTTTTTEPPSSTSTTFKQTHKVIKRYGPGTLVYTKELHGRSTKPTNILARQHTTNISAAGKRSTITHRHTHSQAGYPQGKEVCKRVKTLTDTRLIEIPSRMFEDFLSVSRRAEVVRFLMELQEANGKVVVMNDGRKNSEEVGHALAHAQGEGMMQR